MTVILSTDNQFDTSQENILNNEIANQTEAILTLKQFCSKFPWPSESAMRSYIYRADELGLSNAFLRIRRRVLVQPQKFFALIKQIDSHSNKGEKNEMASWRKGKKGL